MSELGKIAHYLAAWTVAVVVGRKVAFRAYREAEIRGHPPPGYGMLTLYTG
jgi:hypothetical protein